MKSLIIRYSFGTVGLFLVAFAIALTIISNLGVAPLSCMAYVFGLQYSQISVGTFVILVNMLYMLVQIVLLRRRFELKSLMQIPASLLFGYMIDASLWMLSWLEPNSFIASLSLIILSAMVTALGVSIEIAAKSWMASAEMTVAALVDVSKGDFGKLKIAMDASVVAIAAVLGLIYWGHPLGQADAGFMDLLLAHVPGVVIGIGTLIMAVLPGYMMRWTDKLILNFSKTHYGMKLFSHFDRI